MFQIRRTPLDGLLLLFGLTAGLGVWAAYDRPQALAKFALILGALAVYYLIAWQPARRMWGVAALLSLLAVGVGVYYLLTFDWAAQPAYLDVINRLGRAWMAVRPPLPGSLQKNLAGGVLAMLTPFPLALSLWAFRRRRGRVGAAALGLLGATAAALFLTSSRGAWIALAGGLGVWGLGWASRGLARRLGWRPGAVFAGALLVSGLLIGLAVARYPGGIVGLANSLPGAPNGTSRWELAVNTTQLLRGYPFTGGGLRAFEGLYSRYALLIQVPLFTYSHDFYLDVLLEQGLLGGVALAGLLGGSVLLAARPALAEADEVDGLNLLRWAVLASVVVVILHGLVDDALYGQAGTPLLFVWAGLAVAVARPAEAPAIPARPARRRWAFAGLAGLLLVSVGLLVWRPALAALDTDLGAVQLARAELAGWPARPPGATDVAAARLWFARALAVDPEQPVAHARLGLLALEARDFPAATQHLETALRQMPADRGVRKMLGYAYVWQGDFDQAAPLLMDLAEARGELQTYAWWWGTQDRADLAGLAEQMAKRLDTAP